MGHKKRLFVILRVHTTHLFEPRANCALPALVGSLDLSLLLQFDSFSRLD